MNKMLTQTLKTLALIGGCLVLASQAFTEEAVGSAKPVWRLGIQAYTFRALTFFETLDRAHELGLKYIEMYPGQKLKPGSEVKTGTGMSEADVADMQAKLKEDDVKLVSYGVDGIPAEAAWARRRFEWAKKLGIEVLVTETRPNAAIDKLSSEFGIKVAIHNHPTTWPPDKVLAATEGMNPLVGSCADVGHWKRAGLDTVATLKKVGGRVIHSHFKDLEPVGKGMEDVPWGTGQSDARGMLEQMKNQGYQGYYIIEYERGNVVQLMQNLPKCIQFFNQTTAELSK